jgi:type IV pilus assembly protein PilO
VLGEVMEAARNEGVATGDVTYKPSAVKDENLFFYEITMTVSGNYAELKSFLDSLQQIRQLLVIDQITMANSNPFAENINMALRLTVYLREGA